MKFETQAIRLQMERSAQREHSTPLFPTSSFVFEDAEQMRAIFADEQPGNVYSRYTNPNCRELELKMAALEQTEDAMATASGMAAVFAALMSFLQAGDHLIATRALFGSTYKMLSNRLSRWGIETSFVHPTEPEAWSKALRPNTKMLFVETPSNPGLDIVDLEKAGTFAEAHGLIYCVDNCFATPYLQQPAHYGADLIVHSATKFIDGQGRVVGGIVAGKAEQIAEVRAFCRSTGPALSPFNAWLLSKSLETLAVRLDRHCQNAMVMAEFLQSRDEISRVNYPFLDSHPAQAIAKKQMKMGGGLVTFELKGGLAAGRRFLDQLQLLSLSANLGDTRTIATHPASTTHSKLSEEVRQEVGITNGLVRLSIGLEHIDDVIADVSQALVACTQPITKH
ncbi:MAG: aminotransferase class I/II-fold pyridoxal phosphate-dependent enzyme [Bacteroidota bacterium]